MKRLSLLNVLICLLTLPTWAQTGKAYPTAEAAVQALGQAAAEADDALIQEVFGPDYMKIFDEDRTQRKEACRLLQEIMDEGWSLAPTEDGSKIVRLGAEGWPLPIPIISGENGWGFDLTQGVEELLNRRIGQNELVTIETLTQLFVAETEYFSEDRDDDGLKEYTFRFESEPGLKNGLYWKAEEPEEKSPLEKALVSSGLFSTGRVEGAPWWGYYYRALPGQISESGEVVPYVKDDQQTGGFAFVAYPGSYGKSGVMTFLINQEGTIYQKDLGPETLQAIAKMGYFGPLEGWTVVEE